MRLTATGEGIAGTDDELDRAQRWFAADHMVRLPGFLDPALLQSGECRSLAGGIPSVLFRPARTLKNYSVPFRQYAPKRDMPSTATIYLAISRFEESDRDPLVPEQNRTIKIEMGPRLVSIS
jgi:hypothetical protein